ncbi:MAG: hypothetical protein HYR80_04555, partial [Nitrospirae bacterium]|nr:hypothetical protein [Nitrospirota bacterium]
MARWRSVLLIIGFSLFCTVWKGVTLAEDVALLTPAVEHRQEDVTPSIPPLELSTSNSRPDLLQDLTPPGQPNPSNNLNRTDLERRSEERQEPPSSVVTVDASGGNRFLSMHRLDQTFSYQMRQPLSFRGGALMISGKGWDGIFFAGHLADPSKILPSEAILYDELISGIALKVYSFTHKIVLGTTAIQLNQDGPSLFTPLQRGRLLLSEIDLNVAAGFHLLAEYGMLESDPVPGQQVTDGTLLRVGPLYRGGMFSFETQYRRITPTFFLPVWAFENDQEGFFTAFSVTPVSFITFNGSGEVFENNINHDLAAPTWRTSQWQIGMKWAFSTLPVLSITYGERDHSLIGRATAEDSATEFYQIELSKAFWGIDTHAGYRKGNKGDPLPAERRRDTGELSLAFPLYLGSNIWIRGEEYRKQFSGTPSVENGFMISSGGRLRLPFNGILWSEFPIVKSNHEPFEESNPNASSGVGVRFPLPWKADIEASYHV